MIDLPMDTPCITAFYESHPELSMPGRSEVPSGWDRVVADALEELWRLGVEVRQYKEKFGELRIYVRDHDDLAVRRQAVKIIDAAVTSADGICHICGQPAEVARRHWRMCRKHGGDPAPLYLVG